MDIRSKIHSAWESFFPSSAYLILYLWIGSLFVSSTGLDEFLSIRTITLEELTNNDWYKVFKELELVSIIPLLSILLFAFITYVFDKAVTAIGNFFPPFIYWSGSIAMYSDKNVLLHAYLSIRNSDDLASIDAKTRAIIDKYKSEGKSLPSNSLEYINEKFSKAARTTNYGKSGIVYLLALLISAIYSGNPYFQSLLYFFGYSLLFLAIYFVGLMRETSLLIEEMQEKLRVASEISNFEINEEPFDQSRYDKFQNDYEEIRKRSPRLIHFDWQFRIKLRTLIETIIGYNLTRKFIGRIKTRR